MHSFTMVQINETSSTFIQQTNSEITVKKPNLYMVITLTVKTLVLKMYTFENLKIDKYFEALFSQDLFLQKGIDIKKIYHSFLKNQNFDACSTNGKIAVMVLAEKQMDEIFAKKVQIVLQLIEMPISNTVLLQVRMIRMQENARLAEKMREQKSENLCNEYNKKLQAMECKMNDQISKINSKVNDLTKYIKKHQWQLRRMSRQSSSSKSKEERNKVEASDGTTKNKTKGIKKKTIKNSENKGNQRREGNQGNQRREGDQRREENQGDQRREGNQGDQRREGNQGDQRREGNQRNQQNVAKVQKQKKALEESLKTIGYNQTEKAEYFQQAVMLTAHNIDFFDVEGNLIIYKGKNQWTQICLGRMIPKNRVYTLIISIKRSLCGRIAIGVIDKEKFSNKSSYHCNLTCAYVGSQRKVLKGERQQFQLGSGFQEKNFVKLMVDHQKSSIKWEVGGKVQAQTSLNELNQRNLYPYIEMYDLGDAIEIVR